MKDGSSFLDWVSSLFGAELELIDGYSEIERKEIASLVESYLNEIPVQSWNVKPSKLPSGARLLDEPPRMAILAIETAMALEAEKYRSGKKADSDYVRQQMSRKLVSELCRRTLPFTSDSARPLLRLLVRLQAREGLPVQSAFALTLLRIAKTGGWLTEVRTEAVALREAVDGSALRDVADVRNFKNELDKFIHEDSGARLPGFLAPKDAWGELAIADLETMDAATRKRWADVLAYAAGAKGAAPSGKWLKAGAAIVDAFGKDEFARQTVSWLAMLPPRRESGTRLMIADNNGNVLKGLAWLLVHVPTEETARALGDAAEQAFRKVPNWGSRSTKVGNACVQALKLLPALIGARELAILRSRLKKPSHASAVAKALNECAAREGTSTEEIEELATPDHGFAAGTRRYAFGDLTAQLTVDGSSIRTQWFGADGQPRKAEPANVKREFGAELKVMKRVVKDAEKALAAARDRMERLLLDGREWPVDTWRERYHGHPLIGSLAQRLIWRFRKNGGECPAVYVDGGWVDEGGNAADIEHTIVSPWHPVAVPPESVRRWRALLSAHGVTQPFKQAHREIYLLTDAERQTGIYSNRFAAHVLRQHQFASLCIARGWRYTLQGGFDALNTPTIALPKWGLRAEFWVDAILNDEGGISPAGIALLIATDQVKFYAVQADAGPATAHGQSERLPLEQVPPIVFSEVMRDVDLFVGVSSVGMDPTWNDGGPQGTYRDYWASYSFGDLSPFAETRRETISDLLPRLELRHVAHIDGKFLVIKGKLRSYKIHLGSGNILMDPNDQYLCIVPDRSAREFGVTLPFEGDSTLSIVLSKAFLLAQDDQIKDASIMRQIRGN